MKRRLSVSCGAALLLTACVSTPPEPEIRTVTVVVPTAVSCVPANLPPAPQYRVTVGDIIGAADAAERYRLTAAGFQEREARLSEVEPVIALCRAVP